MPGWTGNFRLFPDRPPSDTDDRTEHEAPSTKAEPLSDGKTR